jgi:outer membrane protein assembly factor BamB
MSIAARAVSMLTLVALLGATRPAIASSGVAFGSDDHHVDSIAVQTGDATPEPAEPADKPRAREFPMFHGNAAHTGLVYGPGPDPSKPIGELWRLTAGDGIHSSAVIVDGIVYAGSWDRTLYALDAATGAVVWTFGTGHWIFASPAVAGGVVYLPGGDGFLYALDAKTGALLWTFQAPTSFQGSATVEKGVVYLASIDPNPRDETSTALDTPLYAIDASSGALLWQYDLKSAVVSSVAVANSTVYAGSLDGFLYAVDAESGEEKWRYNTGREIWSSPAVSHGRVFAGTNGGSVVAVDAKRGTLVWQYDRDFSDFKSSPAVANGFVYIGSTGHLYALDEKTGEMRWEFAAGTVDSSPAISEGVVYFGSWDKKLYAVDAVSGAELWSYELGGTTTAPPAVIDGFVYIGCQDFNLYAIGNLPE